MPIAYVGAATAVAGAVSSAVGSGSQASATKDATAAANAQQQQELDYAKSIQQPYMAAGSGALTQANALLGLSGPDAATKAFSTYQASPGLAYQEQQGLSAVDNGAAARGMLRSGSTLRAEQTLGNNLANQDFTTYYNRLANLVGTGATATNTLTSAAFGTGQGIASTDTSGANQLSNIYGNESAGISTALNSAGSNALYYGNKNGWFGSGGGASADPFSNAGTTNINPLSTVGGGFGGVTA